VSSGQEEADRASRGYALPMAADGPRFDEPVTDRFAPEIADNLAVNLKDGEGDDQRSSGEVAGLAGISRSAGAALMLTVGESGGCRSAARSHFPV
jgi:hypothetical protein